MRARRTGIRCCHQAAPGNEIGGTVVTVDDAFDQRRPIVIGERYLDRRGQLSAIGDADAASATVLGVERRDQPGIVPVLDIVVGTIMDLNLDRVSMIIDQEDDNRQLPPFS